MNRKPQLETTPCRYQAQDYFILICQNGGSHHVLSPDFKIEVTATLAESELPRWLAHIVCEVEAEMGRRLRQSWPKPKTLKQILIQKGKKSSPQALAQSLGVSPRTIQLHRKKGLLSKKGALSCEQKVSSHLDYPLVLGYHDKVRRIFSPDLRVGKTLDFTLDRERSLNHAIQTLLSLMAQAFKKFDPKPKPSPLRETHQITPQNQDFLTSSDLAVLLSVSPKTILRKYRHLAQTTPGGHLRWASQVTLRLKKENLALNEPEYPLKQREEA